MDYMYFHRNCLVINTISTTYCNITHTRAHSASRTHTHMRTVCTLCAVMRSVPHTHTHTPVHYVQGTH